MQLLASEFSADYYTRPLGIVNLLMLTITYMQGMTLPIHTQGRFSNHTVHSLYRILVISTNVVGVTKMANTMPRMGLEPTSLAYRASVLPLHHIGSLMLPLCPCPPVYVALCLRGQCRLLHDLGSLIQSPYQCLPVYVPPCLRGQCR